MIREEFNFWIQFERKNIVESNCIFSYTFLTSSKNNTNNTLDLILFWICVIGVVINK